MALRRTLAKRLFNMRNRDSPSLSIPHAPQTNSKNLIQRELVTSPSSAVKGFFGRFLHRRSIIQTSHLPDFMSIAVGEKLREKLWPINCAGAADRIRLNAPAENLGISVHDVKKIARSSRMEKVRSALRQIPATSIAYSELVKMSIEVCESREEGLECAKMLDQAGNVIVLGQIVFIRPDQVAKAMEKLLNECAAIPNDPRKKELEQMEKEKSEIDRKAESLVRRELYGGLGFIVVQTMAFMRLTFWELSWDVMEPICFFVTSFHFALAYGFFLKTSKEPTFESFFQRRFNVKQEKLIKIHNFDVEKHRELRKAFYLN